MPQIINEGPGIGALLGTGLGQGFSHGLNQLAQNKLNQVLQRHQVEQTSRGLSALGIPEQQAQQIAMLPPELQSVVVKNYLQGAESAGLDQALQGVLGTGAQEVQQEEQNGLQELIQQAPPQRKLELTGKDALFNAIEEIQARKNPQQQVEQLKEKPTPTQTGTPKVPDIKDVLLRPRLSPEQRLKVAALQQQRQQHLEKLSAKEQENVDKETKETYDVVNKEYKAARDSLKRLDMMERLIVRGGLNSVGFSSFVTTMKDLFKADFTGLETADTQEFRKLSNDFVKNAKDYFGGRLTDTDLKTFLSTVPSVTQSDDAKLRVIQNLRLFADIATAKKEISDQIKAENNGKRPRDYEEQISKRIKPIEDKLLAKFYANKKALEDLDARLKAGR